MSTITANPIAAMWTVYQKEPCARSFEEDLLEYLHHGFVFSRPDFFIMGRAVMKDADPADIVNPCVRFPSAQCDCWHVAAFAGNMAPAWQIMPWSLPWISMERRNNLRFYEMERIKGLFNFTAV